MLTFSSPNEAGQVKQLIQIMSTILFELISTLSSPDEAGQAVDHSREHHLVCLTPLS